MTNIKFKLWTNVFVSPINIFVNNLFNDQFR